MTAVGRFVRRVFGIDDAVSAAQPARRTQAELRAEDAAKTAARVAHVEAQDARRRRIRTETEEGGFGRINNASAFLANRGTRYSGLKTTLGG